MLTGPVACLTNILSLSKTKTHRSPLPPPSSACPSQTPTGESCWGCCMADWQTACRCMWMRSVLYWDHLAFAALWIVNMIYVSAICHSNDGNVFQPLRSNTSEWSPWNMGQTFMVPKWWMRLIWCCTSAVLCTWSYLTNVSILNHETKMVNMVNIIAAKHCDAWVQPHRAASMGETLVLFLQRCLSLVFMSLSFLFTLQVSCVSFQLDCIGLFQVFDLGKFVMHYH